MALNTQAQWNAIFLALFGTTPSAAQAATFIAEDNAQGDAATISTFLASDAVQQEVIPVIQIIQLATGLAPNPLQLKNWVNDVATLEAQGQTANQALLSVAQAWVNNSNFQAQYGTTSTSIINGIYAKAFGIVPTAAQVAAWSVDTPAQILLAFATSTTYTHTLAPFVNVYLTDVVENAGGLGAVFPSGSLTSLPIPVALTPQPLTVGQDTLTGTGSDEFNGPLAGIFGNQPTLTVGDSIIDSGNNNVLNASFDGGAFVTGLTIKGVQTWNFNQFGFGSTLTILGGSLVGGAGPNGAANQNGGVNTVTFENSVGNLQLGIAGAGINSVITTLTLANNGGPGVPFVNIQEAAAGFTGTDTLTVNLNNVAGTSTWYAVTAGPDSGAKGYQTWNINVQGAGEKIELGADGATNAKTINVSGGGLLLNAAASPNEWANVTTITGSTTGLLSISGAEGAIGGFGNGFLATNHSITSIIQTGTGGLKADLTSLTAAQAAALITVNAGSGLGEVEFNNGAITGVTAPVNLVSIDLLDDSSNGQGGTINMANWPIVPGAATIDGISMPELQFLSSASATSGAVFGSNLSITNGLTDMFVQFNNQDMGGVNVTITAALGNLNGGVDELAVGLSHTGAVTTFTANNYTTVDLVGPGSGTALWGTTNFIVNSPIGDPFATTVNVSGGGAIDLGNIAGAIEGIASVQLNGTGNTTIADTGSNLLVLGVTNAHTVTYNGTGALFMQAPATDITGDFVAKVSGESIGGSLVQGSLGAVSHIGGNAIAGSAGNFSGAVGNDTLQGGTGGDAIFGAGGADLITLTGHAGLGNDVFFGGYADANPLHASLTGVNPDNVSGLSTNIVFQEITNAADDAFQGFWGVANGSGPTLITSLFGGATGGTSADMSTINGFSIGGVDGVTFFTDAWSGGNATNGGLYALGGGILHNTANSLSGPATNAVEIPNGNLPQIAAANNLLLDAGVGNEAGASALANDLHTIDPFSLAQIAFGAGAHEHILVAYASGNGVNIADVDLVNTGGGIFNLLGVSTTQLNVYASDMVHLTGINLADLTNANIHFA